jgi:hypothetical protein
MAEYACVLPQVPAFPAQTTTMSVGPRNCDLYMALLALLCLALIAVYSVTEIRMHSAQLRFWLAIPYFFLLGIGLGACAFALVNCILASLANTKEARGWFELFALIGSVGGGIITVCCGGVAAIMRKRLWIIRVVVGSLILFCVLAGLFTACAANPGLNWW